MIILCKGQDGANLFEMDFMVPPVVGDVIMRSNGGRVVQRWTVANRVHTFSEERESAPCFLVLAPL